MKIKSLFDKEINETLLKSGVYIFIRLFSFLFTYIFALFIVKFFGENIYGLVILSFAVFTIVSAVCTIGFEINLTKLFAEKDSIKRHTSKYFTSIFISFLFSSVVSWLIYINAGYISEALFQKPELTNFLKWTIITIPFWVVILITAGVFRGLKNIFLFTIFISLGRFLLTTLILVVLFFFGKQYAELAELPVIAHFLGIVTLFFIAIYLLTKKLDKPKLLLNKNFKKYFKSSLPVLFSSALIILLTWIDKIFLGVFIEEAKVGVYDIAVRIAMLIIFSLDAVNSILTPKISSAYYSNNLMAMQKEINFISKINFVISLVVFIIILLFNKLIFGLFGINFLIGESVVIILGVGQLINSYTGPVWNIMQMTGHQTLLSKILLITIVMNVFLNIILIKKYGINGAAIATAISLVFWNCLASYYIYKKLKIRTFYFPRKLKINYYN